MNDNDGQTLIAGVLYDDETGEEAETGNLSIDGNPGAARVDRDTSILAEWESADSDLVLVAMDHEGGHTKAEMTISAALHDGASLVEASTELTLGDLVALRDWLNARIEEVQS